MEEVGCRGADPRGPDIGGGDDRLHRYWRGGAGDVNWLAALSAGGMGFVIAILLALAGLPEVEKTETEN